MAYQRELVRVHQLERHITGNFNFTEHDPSLDQFRQRGMPFDHAEVRRQFLCPLPDYYQEILDVMENSENFNHWEDFNKDREFLRAKGLRQVLEVYQKFQLTLEEDIANPLRKFVIIRALDIYNTGTTTRFSVSLVLYHDAIRLYGSEKHRPFLERCNSMEDYGCFCMTEMGHGSNVGGLETEARYDHATREFVINTPTPTATKMWPGNLGKTANMAVVYARLLMGDVDHGIHAFIVPIRNWYTHEPLAGRIIGDLGEKIGMNNLDNGFLILRNVRIPYDNLLDKLSQITPEGKYVTTVDSPAKRVGLMLGAMVRGRLSVTVGGPTTMHKALQIAIRYTAVRKQFGNPENPVLDYPIIRYKLMPQLARMHVTMIAGQKMGEIIVETLPYVQTDPTGPQNSQMHAIMSAFKPLCAVYCVEGTQKCREACAAKGYGAYSMLSEIRAQADINMTWEGDVEVLPQQTSRFMLRQFQLAQAGKPAESQWFSFISANSEQLLKKRATFNNLTELTPNDWIAMLEHKTNLLLLNGYNLLLKNSPDGQARGMGWEKSLVFGLKEPAFSFAELFSAKSYYEKLSQLKDANARQLLSYLLELYVLDCIEKGASVMIGAGYFSPKQLRALRDRIIELCNICADNSVTFMDAVGYPDKIIGSPLAFADGQVYKHYTEVIESQENVYKRADWTKVYLDWRRATFGQ